MSNTKRSELNNEEEVKGHRFEGFKKILDLNFKLLFSTKIIFTLGLVLPFFITLGFSCFLPVWFSFTLIIYVSTLLSTSITFGSLSYTYNSSTFRKNLSLTRVTRESTIFSIWACMMVVSLINIITVMFSMVILTELNIAMTQFSFMKLDPAPTIDWHLINVSMLSYYWFILTSIIFTFSMFVQRFFEARNSYYTFVLTYLVLTLFTGGTMSATWTYVDGQFHIMTQEDWLAQGEGGFPKVFGALSPYLKGSPLWVISQIFPTYHINQLAFNTILPGVVIDPSVAIDGPGYNLQQMVDVNTTYGPLKEAQWDNPDWIYYFWAPEANILFYYLLFRATIILD